MIGKLHLLISGIDKMTFTVISVAAIFVFAGSVGSYPSLVKFGVVACFCWAAILGCGHSIVFLQNGFDQDDKVKAPSSNAPKQEYHLSTSHECRQFGILWENLESSDR